MPRVTQRESARRDLVEHVVHLAEQAGIEAAERFLDNAEASFKLLGRSPEWARHSRFARLSLPAFAKWSVEGFENVLVFYLPRPNGIAVIRVLHASRDWWAGTGLVT